LGRWLWLLDLLDCKAAANRRTPNYEESSIHEAVSAFMETQLEHSPNDLAKFAAHIDNPGIPNILKPETIHIRGHQGEWHAYRTSPGQ
jgi:hypothetical protein